MQTARTDSRAVDTHIGLHDYQRLPEQLPRRQQLRQDQGQSLPPHERRTLGHMARQHQDLLVVSDDQLAAVIPRDLRSASIR